MRRHTPHLGGLGAAETRLVKVRREDWQERGMERQVQVQAKWRSDKKQRHC